MAAIKKESKVEYKNTIMTVDDRGVAYVTFNRPGVHNAMSAEFIQEVLHICATIEASKTIR